jgi:acetoacetyl-CoA synthetase
VCDSYTYGGNTFDVSDKISEIARQLPSLQHIVLVSGIVAKELNTAAVPHSRWSELMGTRVEGALEFKQLPFAHPLYIVFTSGTTGKPKSLASCHRTALATFSIMMAEWEWPTPPRTITCRRRS